MKKKKTYQAPLSTIVTMESVEPIASSDTKVTTGDWTKTDKGDNDTWGTGGNGAKSNNMYFGNENN